LVVDRVLVGGLTPDECLLLTSTRVAAARLRERVTARLARTSTEPLAPHAPGVRIRGSCGGRPRFGVTNLRA
jgi:ATP-dependent exoDNAse (exonuclease V) beta subunit